MKSDIFFSVVIPTFNRSSFIKKCVDSVLAQTHDNFDIIVIDDGSTDDTSKILSFMTDTRLHYHYQDHKGVSSARNAGIKRSTSEFIAFLDSDDAWDVQKLAFTARYIKAFPDIKIFHTEEIWYKNGNVMPQKPQHKKPDGSVYKNALPLCCIGMSTSVVHHSVFSDIGVFDETMEACEDYDLWLRAAVKYAVKLIPEALTIKDGGRPDQLSIKTWGLDRFRIQALEKMLKSGQLNDELRKLTLSELEKKCKIFAIGCEKRGRIKEAEIYRSLFEKYV